MAGIMALALAVFGSVFMTQTQLYDAKDNELLLSMPIRPLHILMSRMAVLLVLTGVFSLCRAAAGLRCVRRGLRRDGAASLSAGCFRPRR